MNTTVDSMERGTTTMGTQTDPPRPLTSEELAEVIRTLREFKRWSQETLAVMSGLSVETVQQIEQGEPSDLDTRRALARALQFEDVDAFDKPYSTPSPQEIKEARELFEREHLTLDIQIAASGPELAYLFEVGTMDHAWPAFALGDGNSQAFDSLVARLREYRDRVEGCSETEKLDLYAAIQTQLDALTEGGVSVCYARRDAKLVGLPLPVTIVYLVAYPRGQESEQLVVPRRIRIGQQGSDGG
jgi:transcriptional regulator with XRE-family HTH domain